MTSEGRMSRQMLPDPSAAPCDPVSRAPVCCRECQRRYDAAPANEHGWHDPRLTHHVGNAALVRLGHRIYFDRTGRIALCSANPVRP
jgi:hypothetical protein